MMAEEKEPEIPAMVDEEPEDSEEEWKQETNQNRMKEPK